MSGSFDVEVHLGNDAMQTPEDVARALRRVADRLDAGSTVGAVQDDNGATVGHFGFNEDEEL